MKRVVLKCVLAILLFASVCPKMMAESSALVEKENESRVLKALESFEKRANKHVNFSGFILGRYWYDSSKNNSGNFDIRMLRLILSGAITKDFAYRVQMEAAGGPRILDAWAEWKRYQFFQVRAGQMKRPFTFENPWSPVTLGVPDYSEIIMKLSGFTDRVGEHACGGRDIGIMLSGDFLPVASHSLFRYEVGVFNGNGINKNDNNSSKDIIGSLYLKPIKSLRIGGGYWLGEYGPEETKVDRQRWTVGFSFDNGKYVLRSEYIASKGQILDKPDSAPKSDGWYVTGGAPLCKSLKAFLKYDVYRDDQTKSTQVSKYIASLNWSVNKFIILQASYYYKDPMMPKLEGSNNAVAQMFIRF